MLRIASMANSWSGRITSILLSGGREGAGGASGRPDHSDEERHEEHDDENHGRQIAQSCGGQGHVEKVAGLAVSRCQPQDT